MYLRFLQKFSEAEPLEPDEWKIIEKQLATILTNIIDPKVLEKFFEKMPQAQAKIDNNPDAYMICAFASGNAAVYDYLKERLPADFDPWEYNKQHNYLPIITAVLSGNQSLVERLLPSIPEEAANALASGDIPALQKFQWPMFDRYNPPEYIVDVCKTTLAFVKGMPEKYRLPLICRRDFTFLMPSVMASDSDTFRQFVDMMPAGSVRHLIQTPSFGISHGIEGHTRGDPAKILEIISDKIGAENFITAKIKRDRPKRIVSQEHNARYDNALGELIFSYALRPYPSALIKTILEKLPQKMVDEFLTKNEYFLFRESLFLHRDERFRTLQGVLSPEKRKELYDHGVLNSVKSLACLGDDDMYHALKDIFPVEYGKFFNEKRPKFVNPEDEPKVRKSHEYYIGRRKEARESGIPKELISIKQQPTFNQALYDELLPLVKTAKWLENCHGDPEVMAAKFAVLFKTRKQVDKYLDRMVAGYGGEHNQPLHDAALYSLPEKPFNAARWRRIVTDFGPAASRFLGLADKIDAYAKEHKLPLPKKPKDLAMIAQHVAYKRGSERLQLAKACLTYGIPEKKFDRILDLLANQLTSEKNSEPVILKTESEVPAITVDGADIGLPGFHMKKLDLVAATEQEIARQSSDHELTPQEMAAILGKMSHCCQSVGDAGEKYVLHGMTSKQSDFYVWTKDLPDGSERVIAQSWTWVSKMPRKGITFDSIEPLGSAHNHIFSSFLQEFAHRAHQEHGYEKVTIGKGGKTPRDMDFDTAKVPLRLQDFDFNNSGATYDSREQWEVKIRNHTSSPAKTRS